MGNNISGLSRGLSNVLVLFIMVNSRMKMVILILNIDGGLMNLMNCVWKFLVSVVVKVLIVSVFCLIKNGFMFMEIVVVLLLCMVC